eukprot:gene6612-9682_t
MSLMDPALYQQQMLAERTRQSTSFLSQAYSSDGRWLAAGDATGQIAIWDVGSALKAAGTEEGREASSEATVGPVLRFSAHGGSVYSLCTYEGLLVSAGGPEIHAWSWNALVAEGAAGGQGTNAAAAPAPFWTTYTADPDARTIEGPIEINDLAADTQAGNLLAAGGDGRVHIFNIKSQKKLGTLDTPAGGMLHCVNVLPSSRRYYCTNAHFTEAGVCAVGNDGTYRTWASNGDVQLAVGVSSGISFSAAQCTTTDPSMKGIITVAGNSPTVDIIASAGHKASVSLSI